jgi:SWIM zinc finger
MQTTTQPKPSKKAIATTGMKVTIAPWRWSTRIAGAVGVFVRDQKSQAESARYIALMGAAYATATAERWVKAYGLWLGSNITHAGFGEYQVWSNGSAKRVALFGALGPSCTCGDFEHRGQVARRPCKHILAAQLFAYADNLAASEAQEARVGAAPRPQFPR